ncbi:class I SAM-dependent methyltransferase [Methanogenium sp. S4BF]|uniref:class I SAM-dependent methyltransferase n=1 Tax=Methanogenium sp. S4BF TaxID=1789226 RepID=UPI0024159A8F|nr:class I SAM-dependent methyltransferase [Methanogenium sp. S4BF]WFN34899.1 class I SAM-dependent methyltransferase [Methanogenium sp. S4BF]
MKHDRVCPMSEARHMDNFFRRFIHPPKYIFGRFIHTGDTVIDIGCGPGFFSCPIARMVGETGRVIAIDLQDGMLAMLREKAAKEGVSSVIEVRKAELSRLNTGCRGDADFALAFYVMHELPDILQGFREVAAALRPGARMLVAEPFMHVSAGEYDETCRLAGVAGFAVVERPRILFSRAVVLEKMV